MSKAGKIVLIVSGIIGLILLIIIGSGVYWWQTKGQEFMEAGRKAAIAGEKFGKSTEEKGCLDFALNRLDACTSMSCEIYNSVFLANCLSESNKTSGFCKGIPPQSEIMQSARWRLAACEKLGRKGQRCPRMMGVVQKYCTQPQKE